MTKEELLRIDSEKTILIDIWQDRELNELPKLDQAIHVPMRELIEKVEKNVLPKDKKIVTVCRSGARCVMMHQFLSEHGYQADYLEGGMIGQDD